jgi:hypothetical protein
MARLLLSYITLCYQRSILSILQELDVCVGVARTSLRDPSTSSGQRAARSLLPRSGTTKLSDHRSPSLNLGGYAIAHHR